MKRLAAVVGILAALTLVPTSPVGAGRPATSGPTITYNFDGGINALVAAQAFTPELFESPGPDVAGACVLNAATGDAQFASRSMTCPNFSPGTYTVGATGTGNYAVQGASCIINNLIERFTDPDATFTWIEASFDGNCSIVLAAPVLHVDVVVNGGTAALADFTAEVFDTDGATLPSSTLADPGSGDCYDSQSFIAGNCGRVELVAGDYFLGVTPVAGYVPTAQCQAGPTPDEQIPGSGGQFSHGASGIDTFCRITVTYTTQTISADIVVTNNNGGTANGSAFTIEVYDASNTLVASGVDPEPGTGNASYVSSPLPIGNYTLGVAGPAGYAYTAVVTAVDVVVPTERLTDPSAAFTLSATQSAAAVITADDPVPPPTTTTTTPTTVPASTVDPNAVLPATGTASSTILMWALAAFFLGSGTILVARRP